MDLALSPDLDARICYLVVLICALISARIQVYKRLVALNIRGIWVVPSTWVMFAIYVFTPLALFWFLDRASALKDTSLFSALLIGLAYPAVLAGGFGGLKPPSGIDGVLKPIEALTDAVIKSVNKTAARNEKRLEDYIVHRMTEKPEIFTYVLNMVRANAPDVAALEGELRELETQVTDPRLLADKKARRIYLYLSGIPHFLTVLTKDKVVFQRWWNSPVYQTRAVVWSVSVLIALVLAGAAYAVTRPVPMISYHTWRLSKVNNSPQDLFRARESLAFHLRQPETGTNACNVLARAMRAPNVPVERIDIYLQLLLQARDRGEHTGLLCGNLVESLRVDSVDARARIHYALVFLATQHHATFKEDQKDLASWNPNTGDTIATLETRIDQWKTFFKTTTDKARKVTTSAL